MNKSTNTTSKSKSSQGKTTQNKSSGRTTGTSTKTRTSSTNSTTRNAGSASTRSSSSVSTNRNVSSGVKQLGNQATSVYNDKQILQDTLMSQKHITDAYNNYAGECANDRLRSTMLNILNDEHNIQATIFSSMQTNGWYQTEPATSKSIQKAKQKVSSN